MQSFPIHSAMWTLLIACIFVVCLVVSTADVSLTTDTNMSRCVHSAVLSHRPGGTNETLQASLLACAPLTSIDKRCSLKCALEAIGVYWACAAACVAKLAPNRCITAECPAAVAAFDVLCLRGCHHTDTGDGNGL